MPTREVMKQRLEADNHEESFTVMQGTMIWFLINTVVLPNFSSVLIVNKWSVMFSRCTTTFHSDGLVNRMCECDLWIGF